MFKFETMREPRHGFLYTWRGNANELVTKRSSKAKWNKIKINEKSIR